MTSTGLILNWVNSTDHTHATSWQRRSADMGATWGPDTPVNLGHLDGTLMGTLPCNLDGTLMGTLPCNLDGTLMGTTPIFRLLHPHFLVHWAVLVTRCVLPYTCRTLLRILLQLMKFVWHAGEQGQAKGSCWGAMRLRARTKAGSSCVAQPDTWGISLVARAWQCGPAMTTASRTHSRKAKGRGRPRRVTPQATLPCRSNGMRAT